MESSRLKADSCCLHLSLKDKNITWDKRVKLARYLWSRRSLYLPNKEQYIVDWVTGTLVNRKKAKVPDHVMLPLWTTLADMLVSPRLKQQTVLMKGSIVQAMVDVLCTANPATDLSQAIIRSCHALMGSVQLQQSMMVPANVMIQLLHTVSRLAILSQLELANGVTPTYLSQSKLSGNDTPTALSQSKLSNSATPTDDSQSQLSSSGTPTQLYDLFNIIIEKVMTLHRQYDHQKQISQQVTDTLLLHSACLSQIARNNPCQELMEGVNKLQNLVFTAVFHSGKETSMSKQEDSKNMPPHGLPKGVEDTMQKLEAGLCKPGLLPQEQQTSAILEYLPVIFEAFLTRNILHSKTLSFTMLTKLVEILESEALAPHQNAAMHSLHKILSVIARHDVYSAVEDAERESVQLTWYQQLLGKLLKHDVRCTTAWFWCVSTLLQITPLVVDRKIKMADGFVENTYLTDLLRTAWITAQQVGPAALEAQDQLLCEIVTLYEKLRKVPKLIKALFAVVQEREEGTAIINFPAKFKERFCSCISQLPHATVLAIWSEGLKQLQDHVKNPAVFGYNCSLMYLLMGSSSVWDYTVTMTTTNQINGLLQQIHDLVLQPLFGTEQQDDIKVVTPQYFLLSHMWGECVLMANVFKQDTDLIQDLQRLHAKQTLRKRGEKPALEEYIELLFLIQKVKVETLVGSVKQTDIKNEIKDTLKRLISLKDMESQLWDGSVFSINSENIHVAVWKLLIDHLYMLHPLLPMKDVVKVMVKSLKQVKVKVTSLQSESNKHSITLSSVTHDFMNTSAFCELPPIEVHSVILRTMWQEVMAGIANGNKPSSSKDPAATIVDAVRLAFMSDSAKLKSDDFDDKYLANVTQLIKTLLDLPARRCMQIDMGEILVILQAINKIPVSSQPDVTKTANFLTIVTVLILSGKFCLTPTSFELVMACLESMVDILTEFSGCMVLDGQMPVDEMALALKQVCKSHHNSQIADLFKVVLSSFVSALSCETRWVDKLGKLSIQLSTDIQQESSEVNLQCAVVLIGWSGKILQHHSRLSSKDSVESKHSLDPDIVKHCKEIYSILSQCILKLLDLANDCRPISEVSEGLLRATALILTGPGNEVKVKDKQIGQVFDMCIQWIEEIKDQTLLRSSFRQTEASLTLLKTMCTKGLIADDRICKIWNSAVKILSVSLDCEFEQSKENSVPNVFQNIEDTVVHVLVTIVQTFTASKLQDLLQSFLKQIQDGATSISMTGAILVIWQKLLGVVVDGEKYYAMSLVTKNLMIHLQDQMLQLSTRMKDSSKESQSSETQLVIQLLQTQSVILSHGAQLTTPQAALLSLHSCQSVPWEVINSNTDQLDAVCHAVYDILNQLLVCHTNTVLGSVPSYVHSVIDLLDVVIHVGKQSDDTETTPQNVDRAVALAHLIERLFTLVSSYKVDFSKVSHYLVSAYLTSAQKVTMLPDVKRTLTQAIYKILDICDKHSVAVLNTTLPPGAREMFSSLYEEYRKYHKYTGRV